MTSYHFEDDVKSLLRYFSKENATAQVRAIPGEGLDIPIYILGSSTASAYLAAELGLPYVFASHFAPAMMTQAISIYRSNFKPSPHLSEPYVMVGANFSAAETDKEAQHLFTSLQKLYIGFVSGNYITLPPPGEISSIYSHPAIKSQTDSMTSFTFIGNEDSLRKQINDFRNEIPVNEIIFTNYIYDREQRLEAFKILRQAVD